MIKKYFGSLFLCICFFSLAQNQQNKIEKISVDEYSELKAKGLLKRNVQYAIGGSKEQLISSKAYQDALINIEANKEKNKHTESTLQATGNSCSCLQALDTSFDVVPMFQGTPPNYRNDDGSSAEIQLPFDFCFFGDIFNSCYINNNGNITFFSPLQSWSSDSFPINNSIPIISAFWADIDTRLASSSGLVRYKIAPHYMVVSWDSVGYFNNLIPTTKRNTFQIIISDGLDSIIPGSDNLAFCYGNMDWTAGSYVLGSNIGGGGINGLGGEPTSVGFNYGDGIKFTQVGRFDKSGNTYDGPSGSRDGVDWLDNKSFYFNSCLGNNNLPPLSVSTGNCNTINLCNVNDTFYYEAKFIGPEIGQTIAMSYNFPVGVSGFFVKSITPSNSIIGKIVIGIVNDGTNSGIHNFIVTATDNGVGNSTNSFTITVNISNSGSACSNSTFNGDKFICSGILLTTLKKPSCSSAIGEWNTGSLADSIIVPIGDYYYSSIDSFACSKSYIFNVRQAPNSNASIKGPDTLCSGIKFYYALNNANNFSNYQWQNLVVDTGIVINSDIIVDSLRLIVTGTTIYGCQEVKTKKVIVAPAFQLIIERQGLDTLKQACPLEISKYKASPIIPLGNFKYTWIDINANTEIAYTDTVSVTGTKNIRAIVNKQNVCTNLKSISITPRPSILVTITANKNNNVICPLDTFKLTANSNMYFPPFKYKWLPSLDSLKTISPKLDTTYNVFVKDLFGCQGAANFTIQSIRNIEITGKDFCKNDSTKLLVKSFSGIRSIQWQSGNFLDLPADTAIIIHKADQYVSIIVDTNGCKLIDTINVNYFFQPIVVLNSTANAPQQVSSDFNMSLNINPYNAQFFNSIQWDLGDGKKDSNKTSLIHQYNLADKYEVYVNLLDTNGCRIEEKLTISVFDAIPELNLFTPNGDGINDAFSFKYLDLFSEKKLSVYDRWGKVIFQSNNYENNWSPSELSDGTYFYVLEIGGDNKYNGYVQIISSK
jgi:gliding motility-associated-like protein